MFYFSLKCYSEDVWQGGITFRHTYVFSCCIYNNQSTTISDNQPHQEPAYTISDTMIYRVIQKNMSPLAFKSNNSRPMRRTTLPDTAFERADNFLSNEYIHTRFPFQIASSQAENQKSLGFCVFRFQTDFDEREHFVFVNPLSQHSLHLICKMCTKHPRPTRASIIFSSHLGLSSKRPPRLAMHPFRRFVEACMSLATRCWERASDAPSGCWYLGSSRHTSLSSSPQTKKSMWCLGSSKAKLPTWGIAGRRGHGIVQTVVWSQGNQQELVRLWQTGNAATAI